MTEWFFKKPIESENICYQPMCRTHKDDPHNQTFLVVLHRRTCKLVTPKMLQPVDTLRLCSPIQMHSLSITGIIQFQFHIRNLLFRFSNAARNHIFGQFIDICALMSGFYSIQAFIRVWTHKMRSTS